MNVSNEKAAAVQRILVLQQAGSAENKIRGLRLIGDPRIRLQIESIDADLPPLIDDGSPYLPEKLDVDLILDYLTHPDLSLDLAEIAGNKKIPVIASGKKIKGPTVFTPPVCCALPNHNELGPYGCRFGLPELHIDICHGKIDRIEVLREAPCGATRQAADRMVGREVTDADIHYGLETQYFCTANPAGWDPLWGKSPVHLAGHLHQAAMAKALRTRRDADSF